jgi:hypothetical protein
MFAQHTACPGIFAFEHLTVHGLRFFFQHSAMQGGRHPTRVIADRRFPGFFETLDHLES